MIRLHDLDRRFEPWPPTFPLPPGRPPFRTKKSMTPKKTISRSKLQKMTREHVNRGSLSLCRTQHSHRPPSTALSGPASTQPLSWQNLFSSPSHSKIIYYYLYAMILIIVSSLSLLLIISSFLSLSLSSPSFSNLQIRRLFCTFRILPHCVLWNLPWALCFQFYWNPKAKSRACS